MEILKNHLAEVKFPVPSTLTSATYRVYKDDTEVGSLSNATVSNGVARAQVPYSVTKEEGHYNVVLSFSFQMETHTLERGVEVVTPYLDLYQVKEIIESQNDTEAMEAEAAVRHIINSHCGQTFGHFKGKVSITGSGETYIRLPHRLIKVNTVNNSTYTSQYSLRGGGYYFSFKQPWSVPPIRADWDGWNEATDGVIAAPGWRKLGTFWQDYEYVIDGEWGWSSVPYPVQEAAKLLINDYACGDSLYRDRFLTSMTAADWRIQFHDGAFSDTGNVRANQLLSEYVLPRGWVVI